MLLSVERLDVFYGPVQAIYEVSMGVEEGGIVTVIGPNGAGKSTLLNAIAGLVPCRGRIVFDGVPLDRLGTKERIDAGLSLVPEKRELFAQMSVEDNLLLGGYRRRADGRRALSASMEEVFERFPRLRERRAQIAGSLSGGERQMLALGRALMGRPKLMMLDEPSLGLAPRIVKDIFHIIEDLRRSGVAILLIEQNARAALSVSDHGYVLETGQVTAAAPSAALARDPRVVEAYLGVAREREAEAAR